MQFHPHFVESLAATNIVAFKLDASFPLAGLPSRRVTDISRINIVENGKKCAGYSSRRDRTLFLRKTPRLSASAKHSSCQNIAVHLIFGEEGIGRGQRGASTRGYWFLVRSCPRQTRELVCSSSGRRLNVNPAPRYVRLQCPHEFQR